MKKGFTLAEVLITLAIIGVVAALTIPVVIHKYQQKQLYTQFMKTYNTLVNTINLAVAENGNPDSWSIDFMKEEDAIEQYIFSNLKIASRCPKSNPSQCLGYDYSNLSGSFSEPMVNLAFDQDSLSTNNAPAVILADGSIISVPHIGQYSIKFVFDTNGSKGPNAIGRDIFQMSYITDSSTGKIKWRLSYGKYVKAHMEEGSGSAEFIPSNCDPSVNDRYSGSGCAGRLLLEGKMSY